MQSAQVEPQRNLPLPRESLPPEIMSLIFIYCLNHQPITFPLHHCWPMMPWILGQVCRRWRDIVMAEPRLWASIEVLYLACLDNSGLVEAVREILRRSFKAPISLTCSEFSPFLSVDHHNANNGGVPITEHIIIPNLHRIQHLSLSLSSAALQPILTFPRGFVESLESLDITFASVRGYTSRTHLLPGAITTFDGAHRLRHVKLRGHHLISDMNSLLLPWGQLTSLSLYGITLAPQLMLDVLPECTQLITCTLTIELDVVPGVCSTPRQILLPLLQSLTLRVVFPIAYSHILQHLHLPLLKEFTLDCDACGSWPQDSDLELLAFVHRWGRSVVFFDLFTTQSTFSDDYVELMLREMSSLVDLRLPASHILCPTTIDSMTRGYLVTRLQKFTCSVDYISISAILTFLEARWSDHTADNGSPSQYHAGINYCRIYSNWGDLESKNRVMDIHKRSVECGKDLKIIFTDIDSEYGELYDS